MRLPQFLLQVVRRKWRPRELVGVGLVGGIFLIGALTVWQRVSHQVQGLVDSGKTSGNVQTVNVLDVDRANFGYYIPGTSDAWKFDKSKAVFDKTSGIVKYPVTLTYASTTVNITQQKFPDNLKPRDSGKFQNFIDSANPVRSQDAGKGRLYFMAALQNGAPANGSDTIIYATDDVLMFGRASTVLGYDAWAKLIASMHPH